jgi:hypothetical protein
MARVKPFLWISSSDLHIGVRKGTCFRFSFWGMCDKKRVVWAEQAVHFQGIYTEYDAE